MKSVCVVVCGCVGGRGKERKKKTLVKNSQRGKSLNYSLEKPAAETSTRPSEAVGSKHGFTSNGESCSAPHSCQFRTHWEMRDEQDELSIFLYRVDRKEA